MKSANTILTITGALLVLLLAGSCKKVTDLNTDPNHITPDQAAPDYLMAGVLTATANWYGKEPAGTTPLFSPRCWMASP